MGRNKQRIESVEGYLAHWAVCLQEVWLQENIEEIARHSLNGVINGQHMDALAILDIRTLHPPPHMTVLLR